MLSDDEEYPMDEELKDTLQFLLAKEIQTQATQLDVSVTPQFIEAMTRVVLFQSSASFTLILTGGTLKLMQSGSKEYLAQDLESFAKHGKRATVNTDDLVLCARRNEALQKGLAVKARGLKEKKKQKF